MVFDQGKCSLWGIDNTTPLGRMVETIYLENPEGAAQLLRDHNIEVFDQETALWGLADIASTQQGLEQLIKLHPVYDMTMALKGEIPSDTPEPGKKEIHCEPNDLICQIKKLFTMEVNILKIGIAAMVIYVIYKMMKGN